jgi:glycine/D-amino acid oxidase-like deaminating enzyme
VVDQMHAGPYEHFKSVFSLASGVAQAPVERKWGGIMPFSADGKPLIGRVAALPSDVWCITGFGGMGFLGGGMAGILLAEYMASPSAERRSHVKELLAPADPARFQRSKAKQQR